MLFMYFILQTTLKCILTSHINSFIAMMFCACLTKGMSIMLPLKLNAPLPDFWCSLNSLIKSSAQATFSADGEKAFWTTDTCPG